MMRTISKKMKVAGTVLAAGVLLLSACKKDPAPAPPNEDKDCTNHGKFTKATCVVSLFDDFVILPDGGNEYLVPCETSAGMPTGINDGLPVKFSYEVLSDGKGCQDRVVCDAIPDKPVKYVKITCWETPEMHIY